MPILNPNQSYTFSQIAELDAAPDELLAEFGYDFTRAKTALPINTETLNRLQRTQAEIDQVLPFANLQNATARRELIVAPVIKDLIYEIRAKVRLDYLLEINQHLQGSLAYFLRSPTQKILLVVEAKCGDLNRGFTQLSMAMIALDRWENAPEPNLQPQFLGAVTNGRSWQFGILDRVKKQVTEVLELYSVPREIETVERILIKALMP